MSFSVNTFIDSSYVSADRFQINTEGRFNTIEPRELHVQELNTETISSETLVAGSVVAQTFETNDIDAVQITIDTGTIQGQLNVTTLDASEITASAISTDTLNADNFESDNVTCQTLTTDTLNVVTVRSSIYNTDSVATQSIEIKSSEPLPPTAGTRIYSESITNGSINNASNYKFISNTTTTLTDLFMAEDDSTPAKLIFQGYNTQFPQIVSYNAQIGTLDTDDDYGGEFALLSLARGTTAPYRTLRYQHNGKLAIYSDVNTILWESTNMVSDARRKQNITHIDDARDILSRINGVYFDFIDKSIEGGTRQAGVIAQDIEPHFPECVFKNGHYRVELERITPLLIEGLKSLNEECNNYAPING